MCKQFVNFLQSIFGLFATIFLSLLIHTIQYPSLLVLILYKLTRLSLYRRLYRTYIYITQRTLGSLAVTIVWMCSPCEFIITGDVLSLLQDKNNEALLFIANHQTYVDWVYIWCFSWCLRNDKMKGLHGDLKISLRGDLSYAPIWGWIMIFLDFIFLKRKWDVDKNRIKSSLRRYIENINSFPKLTPGSENICLLIFPEGTVFNEETMKKSITYSSSNAEIRNVFNELSLTHNLKNVLLPRTTGLQYICEELKSQFIKVNICDITLGYPKNNRDEYAYDHYSLINFFTSKSKLKQLHIHIKMHTYGEENSVLNRDNFKRNFIKLYFEKDLLLENYYTTGQFLGNENDSSDVLIKKIEPQFEDVCLLVCSIVLGCISFFFLFL